MLLVGATGLAVQFAARGLSGITVWLLGVLPPFILLPFFALGMIGAGDIKLLAAIGGILGVYPSALLIPASFLFSGIIGAGILLARGCFAERFIVLCRYLKACWLTRTLLPYYDDEAAAKQSGRFAFSYGITCGLLMEWIYFWKMHI